MIKNEGRYIGIFGTVIVHLIAGIIFMSFQIKALERDYSKEFIIEIAPLDESEPEDKLIELPATSLERIFHDDEEMLNIARNLANRPDEKINPDDYIDRVKEELIKSGMLDEDNYIDEQKRINESEADEESNIEKEFIEDKDNKPDESQEMAANYEGPTRIYYELEGRTHTYLPIPIYKCQGSGKVVLRIEVNQRGFVEKAQIESTKSTTADACLIETAVRTALTSRFNSDIHSPKIQVGTLSYHFVAQ
jgi:hypothetical protein